MPSNIPFTFPYEFIPGQKGVVPRPVIPFQIGLTEATATHGFYALIDSGADMCLFSPAVADAIGIPDITTGSKDSVSGVVAGSKADYYVHQVVIKVGGWPYKISVGFMPSLAQLGYGIFGQKGFFDNFVVKMNLKKCEIELKRYS
ncbi:hypothetical protein A3D70_00020 [Candidatus Adlerbacteria bacterium RIFCSPHIGHO2_02_FULL_54_18]|uniref:Peptidase A2 domain-containing protein n=1 Tax=Candidatus Adlerbacteria bacterium RIFCSPHIGHO2_02_FULL_54_18 TaxID=1797241 RepID=A0A1F4Y1L5_9BACT|nr:MAG: hypothetical protein A3D70_00020 [Candidatus Adlerbacteria bacterium RIFCSPHIGHO2_02_FULL_54_18]